MPGIKRRGAHVYIDNDSNVILKRGRNSAVITTSEGPYTGTGSRQAVEADLELAAAAGTSDEGDSAYIAPVMGNLLGATLTKVHNVLAGLIGKFSITGSRSTTYPAAAVIGEVGDGVSECDGGFVAVIGGDSEQTNADAAYGIDYQNSTAGSGFNWVVNGHKEAHDGYNAGVPRKGFARINVNSVDLPVGLYFGIATDDAGIVAQVGADATIGDGSLYVSHADGAGKLFQKQNDVWVDLQA